MNRPYPEQRRTLGALLRVPFQHLAQRVYAEVAREHAAVRPAHGAVFRYVDPAGSRITELAARAGITKQSMAALVEHLAAHGYVRLRPDPRDGRAKLVVLTRRGRAVQRRAEQLSREVEREWSRLLGEGDMRTLRRLLERLYERLPSR